MMETKENKKTFVTTIIIAILLSVILMTFLNASAQNGGMQVPPSQAPIKITELSFSDDEPLEDSEITIFATVLNSGPLTVTNITFSFYLDHEIIRNITDISINTNESIIVNMTWVAKKWNHNISVMASIDDTPLKDSMVGRDIYVEAKPIGDISSLVLALMIIFIILIGTVFIPSIWMALTNAPKKVNK
jgi:hypothetical protein